jgi:hypothetical protein
MLYLNSPPPVRILSQLNNFHTLKQYLFRSISLNSSHAFLVPPHSFIGLFLSCFQNNTLHKFLIILMHSVRPHQLIKYHFIFLAHQKLTTILTRSEAFNVFSFNTVIVAQNSTRNTVNICLFCLCFILCRRRLSDAPIRRPGIPT